MSQESRLEILIARSSASKKMIYFLEKIDAETIGMGSGSTIKMFINDLSEDILRKKCFYSTSYDTTIELRRRGARCVETYLPPERIDLYVDSADEIDRRGNLLKGGGGALFREKIVAYSSEKRFIIADQEKIVDRIGARGRIPVEIQPFSLYYVAKRIRELGLDIEIRTSRGKLGPLISDNGNILADIIVKEPLENPEEFDERIKRIEGVLATGVFPYRDYIILIGTIRGETYILKGEEFLAKYLS